MADDTAELTTAQAPGERAGPIEEEIVGQGAMNRLWRVGDTIRRSRGPWSPGTAALLTHLRERGFTAAPAHLGVDEQQRDVLTWMPGTPVARLRGVDQMAQVGHLLRDFHAASRGFTPPEDARGRLSDVAAEVVDGIVHGDVAPWNLLEQDGRLVALLDWDLAARGRQIEDLAYSAWHFVPLHGEPLGEEAVAPTLQERVLRLRVLCDAYGLSPAQRASFLGDVASMQVRQATRIADAAFAGDVAAQRLWNEGRFTEATSRSLEWLATNRRELQAGLTA